MSYVVVVVPVWEKVGGVRGGAWTGAETGCHFGWEVGRERVRETGTEEVAVDF